MNKKITTLILIVLVLILGIGILIFVNFYKNTESTAVVSQSNDITKETEVDYKLDENENCVYTSKYGFTITYPKKYTAKRMEKAVDFILTDRQSGSSINIVYAKNDGSLKKMTMEEFSASLKDTEIDAELISYKDDTLNNSPVTVANYLYDGNNVTQTILILEDKGYNITVTKCEDISEEVSKDFDNIVNSFALTH